VQYSLKVIFISLLVRPAFFAALGKFHFAANNISIDCRVSGLILVAFDDFFVKPLRVKIWRDFFSAFFGIKSHFCSEGIFVCQHILFTLVTHQLKHCHELIHGFAVNNTLVTLIRIEEELTTHGVNDTAGEILVLHGVRLITCLL
jgi:hypothetical protein